MVVIVMQNGNLNGNKNGREDGNDIASYGFGI